MFAVNDLVVDKNLVRARSSYPVNKVVGYLDGDLLIINHGFSFDGEITEDSYSLTVGSRGWRGSIQRFKESELFTPAEAEAERLRLETVTAALDKEFELVRDQVQEKLNQAASTVKEAAALISHLDKTFYNMTKECRDLFVALESGGWSHSTLECQFPQEKKR